MAFCCDENQLATAQPTPSSAVVDACDAALLDRFELDSRRNEIVFVADVAACAFGKVFKATLPRRGLHGTEMVAVKMLAEDADADAQRTFLRAASTLAGLSHANVVRLIGVGVRQSPLCVVQEYMNAGDLADFLRRPRRGAVSFSFFCV